MRICKVLIIGFPNAGKSTLLNELLDKRISAISPKKDTTKNRLIGSKTINDLQFVFIDTPGVSFRSRNVILNKRAIGNIKDADIVLFIVDSSKKSISKEKELWEKICEENNYLFILNKVDLVKKESLLPMISYFSSFKKVDQVFPLSLVDSSKEINLLNYLEKYAKEGDFEFSIDEEGSSSLSTQDKLLELIKEACFHTYNQEIPHELQIQNITLDKNQLSFQIASKRQSQKGLIIGSQGKNQKRIIDYILKSSKEYGFIINKVFMKVV